ncbi:hypothetical protein ACSBR2_042487 [Camellia fascicularis]
MNGVFVNGVRIVGGQVAELGAGDEVFNGTVSNFGENGCGRVVASVNLLLSQCRQILHSNDPTLSIRKCDFSHRVNSVLGLMLSNVGKFPVGGVSELRGGNLVEPPSGEDSCADQRLEKVNVNANIVQLSSVIHDRETTVVYEANAASECYNVNGNHLQQMEHVGAPLPPNVAKGKPKTLCLDSVVKDNGLPLQQMEHVGAPLANGVANGKPKALCLDSIVKDSGLPLQQMEHVGAPLANGVANGKPKPLRLDSIVKDSGLPFQQIFVATFTSDILWFLSYCDIPAHLPVTIACHNHEGCWSSSPNKRISVPFSDFPNLVVVYPPFPEVIAFGNDCKRSGIACHHPKLLVLQREESIRVVITSANLVEKQVNLYVLNIFMMFYL